MPGPSRPSPAQPHLQPHLSLAHPSPAPPSPASPSRKEISQRKASGVGGHGPPTKVTTGHRPTKGSDASFGLPSAGVALRLWDTAWRPCVARGWVQAEGGERSRRVWEGLPPVTATTLAPLTSPWSHSYLQGGGRVGQRILQQDHSSPLRSVLPGADVTLTRSPVIPTPPAWPLSRVLGCGQIYAAPMGALLQSGCGVVHVGVTSPSHLEQKEWVTTGGVGPWFPW